MNTVTADFWEVIDPQGNPFDLLPILRGAAQLPIVRRMKDRGSAHSDVLLSPECSDTDAYGLAIRIRKVDLPGRGNFHTGDLSPLPFELNEGLAEEVHFLFDRQLQTLVTQRHKIMRASGIVDLVRDVTGTAFDIQPRLRTDAWSRFDRMTSIGSMDLKLRAPAHHPDFSQTIPSMGAFLNEAANEINVHTVELKLSIGKGRNRGSMDLTFAKDLVRAFQEDDGPNRLSVRGRMPNSEKSEVVDFLRDRLVFSGQVEYAERRLNRGQCQQLLRAALDQHREYLQSLL